MPLSCGRTGENTAGILKYDKKERYAPNTETSRLHDEKEEEGGGGTLAAFVKFCLKMRKARSEVDKSIESDEGSKNRVQNRSCCFRVYLRTRGQGSSMTIGVVGVPDKSTCASKCSAIATSSTKKISRVHGPGSNSHR